MLLRAACSSLTLSCVGLPATRNTVGFAVSGSSLEDAAPTFQGESSVRPLGSFDHFGDRPADAGVGVFVSYAGRSDDQPGDDESTWLVGPSASAEGYPVMFGDGGRVVVGGSVRTLYASTTGAWGPFLAQHIGVEIFGYTEGCDVAADNGIWLMCGAGEAGAGASLDTQIGVIEGDIHYAAGISLVVRVPAGFVGGIPFPW